MFTCNGPDGSQSSFYGGPQLSHQIQNYPAVQDVQDVKEYFSYIKPLHAKFPHLHEDEDIVFDRVKLTHSHQKL